jgi:hypothetical protein
MSRTPVGLQGYYTWIPRVIRIKVDAPDWLTEVLVEVS